MNCAGGDPEDGRGDRGLRAGEDGRRHRAVERRLGGEADVELVQAAGQREHRPVRRLGEVGELAPQHAGGASSSRSRAAAGARRRRCARRSPRRARPGSSPRAGRRRRRAAGRSRRGAPTGSRAPVPARPSSYSRAGSAPARPRTVLAEPAVVHRQSLEQLRVGDRQLEVRHAGDPTRAAAALSALPAAEAGDRDPAVRRVEGDPDQPAAFVAPLGAGVAFVEDPAEGDATALAPAVEDAVADAVAVAVADALGEARRALGGGVDRQLRSGAGRSGRDRERRRRGRTPSYGATEGDRWRPSRCSSGLPRGPPSCS